MQDNLNNKPDRPARTIEKLIRGYRPFERLLLIDVVRDKESRPLLLWVGFMLLVGVLVYHWLEGWGLLDALYFCVITLATIGYGDLTPTTPECEAFYHFLRHQRHRYTFRLFRPHPGRPLQRDATQFAGQQRQGCS